MSADASPQVAVLRPRPQAILLVALVVTASAALAAVTAALVTGGNVVLVDAGPIARHGAPVAAVLSDLSAALTLGGALVAGWLLGEEAREARSRALLVAALCAGVWTLSQGLALGFSYAVATGQPVGSPRYGSDIHVFLGTDLGVWLIAGVIVAAATTTVAVLGSSLSLARVVTLLAGIGLFTKAMTGHAAGDADHEVATSTMLVHLLAVGVWVGALAVLQLIPPPDRDRARVIRRFSHLALIAWVALLLSGVWALSVRMNGPSDILTSLYVQIGLAKAALLALLGFLGWQQRRLLTDRVAAETSGTRKAAEAPLREYRRLAVIELAIMGLAVGLAAAMSSSPPPAEDAPPLTGPMAILSGYPLPEAPGLAAVLTSWRPDAFSLAAVAVVLLLWWRPTGPDRDRRSSIRLVIGGALLILLLSGPLAVYAKALVSAHVVLHVTLLLAVGPIAGSVLSIPHRWHRAILRWAPGTASRGRAALLALLGAIPAILLLVVYSSTLLRPALEGHAAHLVLTYLAVLGGAAPMVSARLEMAARREPATAGPRADPGRRLPWSVVLILAVPILVVLAGGITLATTGDLVSARWFGSTGRTWWMDALADQHRGGIAVIVLALLAAGALLAAVFRSRSRPVVSG